MGQKGNMKMFNSAQICSHKCNEIVECDTCKSLFFINRMQEKIYWNHGSSCPIYFCTKHKVKWSIKSVIPISTMGGNLTGEWHTEYKLQNVKCDENGKIMRR